MVIGNFKDDANTPLITIGGPFALEAVYTYIDDVSLTICTGVNDVSTVGANAYVYPNPFADILNVTTDENEPAEIILYDITYRQLKRQSFSGSVSVNTTDLAKGTYLYKVQNKNGLLKTGKVIKD